MAVVLIYFIPDVMRVFFLITTVAAILFMFIWSMILCAYLAYRKKQPHRHQTSIYKMPAGIVMSWVCLLFFVFVLILLTLEKDTRQALLAVPIWFVILLIGYQIAKNRKT